MSETKLHTDAKQDFQILLEHAIDAAAFLLNKNNEFYPFGFSMDDKENVSMNAEDLGEEKPLSQEVIDALAIQFGKTKGLRSAAITTMATYKSQDAVCIEFDHVCGDFMKVVVPYQFKGFKKKLVLGEAIFSKGEKHFMGSYH